MADRVYLTVAEVIAIHHRQIDAYGAAHGLRDEGALESAVYRPQTGYYGSILEEAAALMESLANKRAFIDGNKRVSFDSTHTFLLVNDYTIVADPVETYCFMTDAIAEGKFRFPLILDWLSRHVQLLPASDK